MPKCLEKGSRFCDKTHGRQWKYKREIILPRFFSNMSNFTYKRCQYIMALDWAKK